MVRLLSRIAFSLLLLAALYLIGVNAALQLPATRAVLNGLQPEQFQVTWQRAWSLYPLRIELDAVAADGQTPTEQWQVDARHAAASVSLLPLLLRGEIRVHDLDLEDIDLRLRPRPQAGAEPDALVEFYPLIRNRDPHAPAEPVPEDASGALVLEINDIKLKGEHRFWVSHIRGSLPGIVRGSVRMETESGQLALAGGALDLRLASLTIGPEQPVTDDASIVGTIEVPPFKISETKGLQYTRLATVDARIDLPVQNLDFLALLIPPVEQLALSGQGRLRGRLSLARGEIMPGTDLVVEAHQLGMTFGRYDFSGDGLVELLIDPEIAEQADLTVRFDQVQGQLQPDAASKAQPRPLFSGRGLVARVQAAEVDPTTTSSAERVEELASEVRLELELNIPAMQVPDLAVYSSLFPDDWDLDLLGGTGTLSGALKVSEEQLSLDLDLASDDAELRYADYHATTDLLLELRARIDDADGPTLHLEGTRMGLRDAAVNAIDAEAGRRWEAELRVQGGTLALPISSEDDSVGTATDAVDAVDAETDTETDTKTKPIPLIARQITQDGFGALLSTADGELVATLTVSALDWIAALLDRPLDLSLDGAAEIDAAIQLEDGLLATGSRFEFPPSPLSLALLEHRIDGEGGAALLVEHGGQHPSVRLSVGLDDARIRRRQEPEPSIGNARLDAILRVRNLGAKPAESAQVDLLLHSAEVQDMAVYNQYLPEHAAIAFLDGTARLIADLTLSDDSARGQLLLTTEDIRIALDQQTLTGELQLEVMVNEGTPKAMRFDITGSSLRFDKFRVSGPTSSDLRERWHARLQFEDTDLVWNTPMALRAKADIAIKDTRPFLALIDNLRGKPSWIDKLLTAEDLAGHLQLRIEDERALIEDAMLSSAEIGVHAKGLASADSREGMLLLRWKNLTGAVAMDGDDKHFHLVNAPSRFAAYRPGANPLAPLPASSPTSAETHASVQAHSQDQVAAQPQTAPAAETEKPKQNNPFLNEDL